MNDPTEYIVLSLMHAASTTREGAESIVAEHDALKRAEVLREAADALEARVADVDVDTRTTWAGMDAAYLRHLASSASVPVPDETAGDTAGEVEFFQPGRTYFRGDGYTAPELIVIFRVEHVTRHPDRGRRLIGWMKSGAPDARWHGHFQDEANFGLWTDITDDEARDTEGGGR